PPALVEDPQVERSVVSLPHLVWATGFAAMEQIEAFGVGPCPLVCQSDKWWIEPPDQHVHLAIAWLSPAPLPRDHRHLALNRRQRAWRPLECEPLKRLAQPRSQAVASAIGTLGPYETAQALSPIATHPPLHGPLWHVELTGKPC